MTKAKRTRLVERRNEARRGTGRSSRQIQEAPHGAIFVSCVPQSTWYFKELAAKLGRTDLRVVPTTVLLNGGMQLRGLDVKIVLDHALPMLNGYLQGIDFVQAHNTKIESLKCNFSTK